jgi:hypothetical protein
MAQRVAGLSWSSIQFFLLLSMRTALVGLFTVKHYNIMIVDSKFSGFQVYFSSGSFC